MKSHQQTINDIANLTATEEIKFLLAFDFFVRTFGEENINKENFGIIVENRKVSHSTIKRVFLYGKCLINATFIPFKR